MAEKSRERGEEKGILGGSMESRFVNSKGRLLVSSPTSKNLGSHHWVLTSKNLNRQKNQQLFLAPLNP